MKNQQETIVSAEHSPVWTQEDLEKIKELKNKLRPEDSNSISLFGTDIQRQMAELSQTILQNLGKSEAGEINDLLAETVVYLKAIEDGSEKKGFMFLKKKVNKLSLQSRYDKAREYVEQIENSLQQYQMKLLMDSAMLDQLCKMNEEYHRALLLLITAIKEVIQECKMGGASAVGGALDKKWLSSTVDRLEKKAQGLEVTRLVASQQIPQLMMLKGNLGFLTEGIQATLYHVIPLWKNQMASQLGAEQAKDADRAEFNRMLVESLQEYARAQEANQLKQSMAEAQFGEMERTMRQAVEKV